MFVVVIEPSSLPTGNYSFGSDGDHIYYGGAVGLISFPTKGPVRLSQTGTAMVTLPESEGNCIYSSQWNFAEFVELFETREVHPIILSLPLGSMALAPSRTSHFGGSF